MSSYGSIDWGQSYWLSPEEVAALGESEEE